MEYRDLQPYRIHSLTVVASQNQPLTPNLQQLEKDIYETVIEPAFADEGIQPDENTRIFVNPDGIDSPGVLPAILV